MIESTQTYAGTYYYHFDASGSVVALTNSPAAIRSRSTTTRPTASRRFRCQPSQPLHVYRAGVRQGNGPVLLRAHYYKPEIGRFLQTDPVGYDAGMNLYRYCTNNPWNSTYPFGLDDFNDRTVCKGWVVLPSELNPNGQEFRKHLGKRRWQVPSPIGIILMIIDRIMSGVGGGIAREATDIAANESQGFRAYLVMQDQQYSWLKGKWKDKGIPTFRW